MQLKLKAYNKSVKRREKHSKNQMPLRSSVQSEEHEPKPKSHCYQSNEFVVSATLLSTEASITT